MKNFLHLLLAFTLFAMVACDPGSTAEPKPADGEATNTADKNADAPSTSSDSSIAPNTNSAERETNDTPIDAGADPLSLDTIESGDNPRVGKVRAQPWIEPADRVEFAFDYDMTDQGGKMVNLTQFKGKPTAVSFMFTNCRTVEMCPMLTSNMATLEKKLIDENLGDAVNLALISYDPKRDTPEAMTNFGKSRGVTFDVVRMLRPDLDTHDDFKYEWGQMDVKYMPDGDIGHYLDLYIFDRHGRLARIYTGGHWSNTAVLEDLRTLLGEPDEVQEPAVEDGEKSSGDDETE